MSPPHTSEGWPCQEDYHGSADWGAVLVAHSATTAPNGIELQQKTRTGTAYTSSPTGPAGAALGVGDDHWISVEVHGKHLDVAIDGSPVSSADNLQRSAGGLGFVISGCTVQFDNVVVTRLSR